MFEVYAINRSVHKRTLEGDGEKTSRHENEGRKPEANIAEILKFQSFEKARNAYVEISPYN